jgi:signal transduction histidine kinase
VVSPGDQVEVTGETDPGIYLPGLGAASCRVLAHRPLPAAIDATYEDLLSGRFHYQRVVLQGEVRSLSSLSENRSLLRLAVGSRVMDVWIEAPLQRERAPVDSLVRVQGVAVGTINSRRQLVQPYVRVSGWSELEILRPALPDSAVPRIAPSELLTYGLARQGGGRVRVAGTVMASFGRGMLYLRSDDNAALGARLSTPVPVQLGDQVEVLGFPEMGRFTASLVDAQLLERRPGAPVAPIKLQLEDLFRGAYDSDLVEVTGRVIDSSRSERERQLVLQRGERRVRVSALDPTVDVPIGSIVRATGISRVTVSEGVGYSSQPEAINLYVRSPDDVFIVARPSAWTVGRLAMISAALAGVVLLAVLWIWLLRRQVRRQAAAARSRIEAEAALEERHRLARDFHDTLEQELVGLGLRLDALQSRDLDEKRRSLIAASRSLVSRIQSETRNLVGDLRNSRGQVTDLTAAFDELLELNAADANCEILITVEPGLPVLPVAVVHNLRMIARESVTNALKHAGATRIEVRLQQRQGEIFLSISDNGRGFDVPRETSGKNGHYGCVGIRERSHKLGAQIQWRSTPGTGTTVELVLPIERMAGTAHATLPGTESDSAAASGLPSRLQS